MKFKKTSVTSQKEILKRKLGGELFEEITLDASAFTDGVCKAGSPIAADGKFVNGRTTGVDSVSVNDAAPVGILLTDVYKDENPNGIILIAFGVLNSANNQTSTGEAVAEAVKTALPLIVFE